MPDLETTDGVRLHRESTVEDAEPTPLDQRPADLAGLLVAFAE